MTRRSFSALRRSIEASASGLASASQPRVLIFSQRGLRVERWQCCGLEMEDVIASVDDAEIVTPAHTATSRHRLKLARAMSRALPSAMLPPTGLSVTPQHATYELLFAEVGNVGELLALDAFRGWRKRCRLAVCFIQEIFITYLPKLRQQLNILKEFDIVFCACAATVGPLSELLGKTITYLPFGVDALRFLPHRAYHERGIDITMIGRQSAVTHEALVEYALLSGAFYYSDTAWAPKIWVKRHADHRELLANLVKNSRFFIANRANFDRKDKIASQQEVGARYFEGIAGGAVLLGDYPRTQVFDEQMGWEDSVIAIPVDCPDVGSVIEDLNRQPRRLEAISRRNVWHTLKRHDWAYRWKSILDSVQLPPTEATLLRISELSKLAAAYEEGVPQANRA